MLCLQPIRKLSVQHLTVMQNLVKYYYFIK